MNVPHAICLRYFNLMHFIRYLTRYKQNCKANTKCN
uniref:Uncharacterized protein n=1 Tax=Anguilla anguilla TaxID=7936 RepID=A0A0E9PVI8_ANGAN